MRKFRLFVIVALIVLLCAAACTAYAEELGLAREPAPVCPECGGDQRLQEKIYAPTCTTYGYTVDVCPVCGWTSAMRDLVIASGAYHNWGEWVEQTAASCLKPGSASHVCGICGTVETAETPVRDHTPTAVIHEPDCLHDGYTEMLCSVCGTQLSVSDTVPHSAAFHRWSDWKIAEQPGCETDGTRERVCTLCGATHRTPVEPAGHTVVTVTVQSSCTSDGFTADVCSVCGEQMGPARDIVPAAHVFGEWETVVEPTVREHGERKRICGACGETETEPLHYMKSAKVPPTCVENGYIQHVCAVCGWTDGSIEKILSADGAYHDWKQGEVLRAPTCTSLGSGVRVCRVCGAEEKVTLPCVGHQIHEVSVPASFTVAGYTVEKCGVCGAEVGMRRHIVPAGMDSTEGTLTVAEGISPDGAAGLLLYTVTGEDGEQYAELRLTVTDGSVTLDLDDDWYAENRVSRVKCVLDGMTVTVPVTGGSLCLSGEYILTGDSFTAEVSCLYAGEAGVPVQTHRVQYPSGFEDGVCCWRGFCVELPADGARAGTLTMSTGTVRNK